MGRRGRKAALYAASGEPTAAREELERKWRPMLSRESELAVMVTAEGAAHEPFHRWLHFRQGFSPSLVRLFLTENDIGHRGTGGRPVLDPFSGSGTCVIECARRNVPAVGVEAVAPLVFLNQVKAEPEFPPLPTLGEFTVWTDVADCLSLPIHRAALMYAVVRQHTSDGKLKPGAPALSKLLAEVIAILRADLSFPLPRANPFHLGDARSLTALDDESVGAILTSPPYLSRHDYSRITQPYAQVYRHWYASGVPVDPKADQVRSHPQARWRPVRDSEAPPSVTEAAAWLAHLGEPKLANLLCAYFEDMRRVVVACARLLRAGGVCWMVLGGARLKGVYIPSDLMVAELAEAAGFELEGVRVARDLIDARRKFGAIGHVAPRESILILRKP